MHSVTKAKARSATVSRVGREAGHQPFDIAGVERPAVCGDEILQGEPVFDSD